MKKLIRSCFVRDHWIGALVGGGAVYSLLEAETVGQLVRNLSILMGATIAVTIIVSVIRFSLKGEGK